MNNIQKRFILFLFGCMIVRTMFAYIAKIVNPKYLPILGILALIPVIGWLNIIFLNPRDVGPETGGQQIWWKNLRPVHLILYTLFAISAILKKQYSWIFLCIDALFGLLSFIVYHFQAGNFSRLLN